MAGIGFEIRKILRERSIFSIVRAFLYSGVVSSGPWIISMVSIFIAGYFANEFFHSQKKAIEFTIMITYLIAFSLILSGFFQLSFTRFVSDLLFEGKRDEVLANTVGVTILNMIVGFLFISPFSISIYMATKNVLLSFAFHNTFLVLNALWIVNVVLTGLKNYKYITYSFLVSYLLIVVLIFFFGNKGIEFFMIAFFIGQAILLFLLMGLLFYEFSSDKLVKFDFLKTHYKDLIWIGFLLNFSIWIDKFLFWYNPSTSEEVIGFLRYSPIYDYPIFLAYLSIAPAMAMFLLRIETDFAFAYDKYFSAAREGGTLKELYMYANDMIDAARVGLSEILRIQLLVVFIIVLFSKPIFNVFKIPIVYIPLFIVDLIGTTLQALFMSILTVLFYLDKRKEVLILVASLFVLNFSLTILSQILGPFFYGYGFTVAYFLVSIGGLYVVNKSLKRIHYETFMLI
jgi:uncharacterized membrane protein